MEDRFETYGASHLTVIGILAAGAVLLVWFGRRHRGDPVAARRVRRVLAVVLLVVVVVLQVLSIVENDDPWTRAMPIQLCDVASAAAIVALWTGGPLSTAVIYVWGLTLTTQAVVTPDISREFPHPIFLTFWGAHIIVVWAAIVLVWGLGIRPTWRGYRVALALTAVWAVGVIAFNQIHDTNYGYLSRKPRSASILDLFGPWPWYIAVQAVLIAGVWALMTWPWERASGRRSVPSMEAQ